jgi:hypothetical protein
MVAAALAVVCCGAAAAIGKRTRLALRLYLAAVGVFTAGAAVGRAWQQLACDVTVAGVVAWMLWHSRRRRPR